MLNLFRYSNSRSLRKLTYKLSLLAVMVLFLYGSPAHAQTPVQAQAIENDDVLLGLMIGTVVFHDVAIIPGFSPTPIIQFFGEGTQLATNLTLKSYRPWLKAPADISAFPNDVDKCSYHFHLPGANVEYENLFGIINLRPSIYDEGQGREYSWADRWGLLGKPRLYHANTSVNLNVSSLNSVSRFDKDGNAYPDYTNYMPVTLVEGPQEVYLPIGTHQFQWQATTQIDYLSDAIIPTALLAIGILSEGKQGRLGLGVGKELKKTGLSDDIADATADAASSSAARKAKKKFGERIKRVVTKCTKPKNDWDREVCSNIRKVLSGLLCNLVNDLFVSRGVEYLDEKVIDALAANGSISPVKKIMLDAAYTALVRNGISTSTATICVAISSDTDGEDFFFMFLSSLLDNVDAGIKIYGREFSIQDIFVKDTSSSTAIQTVNIWDEVPPKISIDPEPVILEATDFEGTRRARVIEQLRSLVTATDNCGRQPVVTDDAPLMLPVNKTTTITWTATDLGPNPTTPPYNSMNFAPTATQTVIVKDTQAPLLLAPPDLVIEDAGPDVDPSGLNLGVPGVIDLADPAPTVTNNTPATFPTDSRLAINWIATDASGNANTKVQWITAKTPGSNNPPEIPVGDITVDTRTAEPVEIRLDGVDVDDLPTSLGYSMVDPLTFEISQYPQNGEFVAPLLPFFIEDFRVTPIGAIEREGVRTNPLADTAPLFVWYDNDADRAQLLRERFCNQGPDTQIPVDFVYKPTYVHVADSGNYYIRDMYWICTYTSGVINAELRDRISKWDRNRNYVAQFDASISPEAELFTVDRGENITFPNYTRNTYISGLKRLNSNLESTQNVILPVDTNNPWTNAHLDSNTGLMFVSSNTGISVYALREITASGGSKALANTIVDSLGKLTVNGQESFLENLDCGLANNSKVWMTTDRDSNLYVAEACSNRIHKFGPSRLNADGTLVAGEYIGWMGRCRANVFPWSGCNEETQTSNGYACTDDRCMRDTTAGTGPGQFDQPVQIAIDPNDILYVADFNNKRVQRFGSDGSFAGQAVSEGSGINTGDAPDFVLGNIGSPRAISVNSSTLYIMQSAQLDFFLHSFKTLPFKPIEVGDGDIDVNGDGFVDNSMLVSYVPHFDFPGTLGLTTGQDMFSYRVNDGLAVSPEKTVMINVTRNYRPPQEHRIYCSNPAAPESSVNCSLAEDTSLLVTLVAEDPDGIVGFDGLDSLTYTPAKPANGTLTLQSSTSATATYLYTPNQDYYGEEQISFSVSDGILNTDSPVFNITVLPVNDPPVINIEAPTRVARGFPLLLQSTLTDDPSESYTGNLGWGDGSSELTGGFVDDNGENPRIEGLAISAPPSSDQEGKTFAEHTFDSTGVHDIQVCVTDSGALEGCDNIEINVEELVSLYVGATVYATPLAEDEIQQSMIADGKPYKYELTIVNGKPSSYAGLTAEDVRLVGELPSNLIIYSVQTNKGMCSRTGTNLNCNLGDLVPGEEVKLIASVQGPGYLIFNEDRDFSGKVSTTTPAVEDTVEFFVSTELIGNKTDTDGDGMTDRYEWAYRLNFWKNDADADPDGDGLTNLEEFDAQTSPRNEDTDGDGVSDYMEVRQGSDPLRDDVPPSLVIPADITIDATGALTAVPLGMVIASDHKDGVLTPVASTSGPFTPGTHRVTWSATDSAGNSVEAIQNVSVVPMVSFAIDRTVAEGTTIQAVVELNGPAVTYPVTIPYTVSGSALNPSDHNAVSGVIQIDAGISSNIAIDIVKDIIAESDESLILTMGVPTNAVPGVKNSQTFTIVERNLAPIVSIMTEQVGEPRTTIAVDAGQVSVNAAVQDNTGNSHSYDWSTSDADVMDSMDYTDQSYLFDPVGLNNGIYGVRVQVTDDGVPIASTHVSSLLKIVSTSPSFDYTLDSDGDGVSDADEGFADTDGDRVPDYLDDLPQTNMLRMFDDGRVLETNAGLQLRLGHTVFAGGGIYSVLAEAALEEEVDYGYPNGVVDFELTGIEPGATARVVYPLKRPLPAGSVYRKYMDGNWQDFVIDDSNVLSSAPGQDGACPPPGSNLYQPGLTVGQGCIQLTIEDGGPNDADHEANGTIQDPGGLAVPVGVNLEVIPVADQTVSTGSETIVMHLRLSSDSGDVELTSLTLHASGNGDDRSITDVKLVVDVNKNGQIDDVDEVIANGQFDQDDGVLQLEMLQPYAIPAGDTYLLVGLSI